MWDLLGPGMEPVYNALAGGLNPWTTSEVPSFLPPTHPPPPLLFIPKASDFKVAYVTLFIFS